ncbi:hypothetical protein Cpir12675_005445 [Ceratocystis pirilliformis]|uniref:Uncharacterized protein n=1 Tax=Ceratocystis pirilliformis TaxID=259994 RepID=A0ABR3YR16_9PEZI
MLSTASASSPAPNGAAASSVLIDSNSLEVDSLLPITPRRQKIGINGSGVLPSPGSLESMLKTTMETGDIGLFSITPRNYRPPTLKHDHREMSLIDAMGEANHPLLTIDGTCDISPTRPKSTASSSQRTQSRSSSSAPLGHNYAIGHERGFSPAPSQLRARGSGTPQSIGPYGSLPRRSRMRPRMPPYSNHPSESSIGYGVNYDPSNSIPPPHDDRYQSSLASESRVRSTSSPFRPYSPRPNQSPSMRSIPSRRHMSAPQIPFMQHMQHPQYPYPYHNDPMSMASPYRRPGSDGSWYGGFHMPMYPPPYGPGPGYFPDMPPPMPPSRGGTPFGPSPSRRKHMSQASIQATRKSTASYSHHDEDPTSNSIQSRPSRETSQVDEDDSIDIPPPEPIVLPRRRNRLSQEHHNPMAMGDYTPMPQHPPMPQLPMYRYPEAHQRPSLYGHPADYHRRHDPMHRRARRPDQHGPPGRHHSGEPPPPQMEKDLRSANKHSHQETSLSTISADESYLSSAESNSMSNDGDSSILKSSTDTDNTTASTVDSTEEGLKPNVVSETPRPPSRGYDAALTLRDNGNATPRPPTRLRSKSSLSLHGPLNQLKEADTRATLADSTQKTPQAAIHNGGKPKFWNRIASRIWRTRSSGRAPVKFASSESTM